MVSEEDSAEKDTFLRRNTDGGDVIGRVLAPGEMLWLVTLCLSSLRRTIVEDAYESQVASKARHG